MRLLSLDLYTVQVKKSLSCRLLSTAYFDCVLLDQTLLPYIFSFPLYHFLSRTLAVTLCLYRINPARIAFIVVLVLSLVCTNRATTTSCVRRVEFKVGNPYDFTVKIDIMFKEVLSPCEQPDFGKWSFWRRWNWWRDGKSLSYLFLMEGFLPFVQHLLVYPLIFILICMQQVTSGMNL